MKMSLTKRLLLSGLMGALALSAAGCWNPFAPPDGDDPKHDVTYQLRTSPENVLYNLKTAYIDMNLGEYLDCLAEEFVFHVNPEDYGNPENEMPESWGKQDEEDIHENMFASDSDVERITLTLTDGQRGYDQGENPLDPMDDRWHYWEGVDLRVTVAGDLTFYATAEQEFIFRIDPLEVGPEDETLYEIIDWWDLEVIGSFRDSPHSEHVTFGGVKALYR